MANNLKGQNGVVGLLLLHGEKIGIAIVGLIAVWFVYSSLNLPHLDESHQAAELQKKISQTNTEIQSFTWDKATTEFPEKVKKAIPIEAKGDLTVNPADYVNTDTKGKPTFGLDNLVIAPMTRRADPKLLNAEDVRAIGGSGPLAFIDENFKKQRETRLAAEAEQKRIKEDNERKRQEKLQNQNAGRPGGRRGGPEGPGAATTEMFDPDHPKRRPLEGPIRAAGVPLEGGERIEQAYWACVVAKVPIRQQANIYEDAFKDARGYDLGRDFPTYMGFYVERAEVLPGKPLEWKPVPLYDGEKKGTLSQPLTSPPNHVIAQDAFTKLLNAAQQFWAGGISPDVVDERFCEFPLTLPLPPLVGRDWGKDATHPDIPLAVDTPPLDTETPQTVAQASDQQPAGNGSPFGPPPNATQSAPGYSMSGPRPGREFPGASRRAIGPGYGPQIGPGGFGPGMPGPGGRGPGAGPEGGAIRSSTGSVAGHHVALTKGVDYYLLRFFDFTVEPGKKYKYRVKLVLQDPNYNLSQDMLAPAVLNRQDKEAREARAHNLSKPWYRMVETWSDPSPTVGIPLAGSIRLVDASVPPAEKYNDEPFVRLLVTSVDFDDRNNPVQASVDTSESPKKDFRRGYVANLVEDAEYLVDGNTAIDTYPNFKFLTGMTILDIDGGSQLTRDMTYPARILVMGPAGQFYVRNEIDDKPSVNYHRLLFEKSNDKNRGPGGGPGYGPAGRRPRR
ncbi:MAG TPA: hypothetical protein VHE81_18150 [Lacipirellulaceae bacterium]|nr:hypothetical protein [Lacipirellulaceae bacterium]